MKKITYLAIFLFTCVLLSACGSVNYAPGKAYIESGAGHASQETE